MENHLDTLKGLINNLIVRVLTGIVTVFFNWVVKYPSISYILLLFFIVVILILIYIIIILYKNRS